MPELRAQRTLVKSPPELWAELSDPAALTRHLGEFGEIRITRVVPEQTVAWEGERASGTVELSASGWGTKVTLRARLNGADRAEAEPDVVATKPDAVAPEPSTPDRPADPFALINSLSREPLTSAVESRPAEEPVDEEPVDEEPVLEEPAVEEPAVEEPALEEPAVEEPSVEERVDDEPVDEEPVVEESDWEPEIEAEMPEDHAEGEDPVLEDVPSHGEPEEWFAGHPEGVPEPTSDPKLDGAPAGRRPGFFARLFASRSRPAQPFATRSLPATQPQVAETATETQPAAEPEQVVEEGPIVRLRKAIVSIPMPAPETIAAREAMQVHDESVEVEPEAAPETDTALETVTSPETEPAYETEMPSETEAAYETETPSEPETPSEREVDSEPDPDSDPDVDSDPVDEPQPVPLPEPEPEPPLPAASQTEADVDGLDPAHAEAVLTAVLDNLGTARHRPFSRG